MGISCPVLLAYRAFDYLIRVRRHYPVIDLGRVHLAVQVPVQSVAEHPDPLRGLLVHLEVVGEVQRRSRVAAGQQSLRGRPEVASRVPAAHPSLGQQVVVHHAVGAHRHAGRLALPVPGAPRVVERGKVLDEVARVQRRVPQRRGRHVELVVAGQRMEVQHPVAGHRLRRQAHAENAVHPVERDAVDPVMAVQRVRIEIRMVDPARSVLRTNSIFTG